MGDIGANHGIGPFSGAFSGRSPAEIERDLAIATLVDLRLLHAGKAASLFRARQVSMQRTVALKVLHDELSSDTGQRFDRERATTGQLSGHTGIVPLFDTGSTADGEPYLVMPFYRRGSLADLMTRYGPLAWQEATFLLEPVAVTLAETHGRELVHRNLKPGNILLTDFLLPRVADFGMCLPIGQMSTPATLVANASYASPETATPQETTPGSDVFGLGATLWGLLAGRAPAPVAAVRRQASAVPDSLAHKQLRRAAWEAPSEATPPAIADLIERSMAPSVADRPRNAAAFVTELRRCVAKTDKAPARLLANATPASGRGEQAFGGPSGVGAPILDVDRDTLDMTDGGVPTERTTPSPLVPHAESNLGSGLPDPVSDPPEAASVASSSHEAPAGEEPETHLEHSRAEIAGLASDASSADDTASADAARQRHGGDTDGADRADGADGENDQGDESDDAAKTGPSTELYLLILVALITTGILIMVAAAFLAVQ